ncbi:MAG TPA: hypothetical protein VGK73_20630 [Polyangiaceae bacterium]
MSLALFVAPNARAEPDPVHGPVDTCQVHYIQDAHSDCEMCEVPAAAPSACSERLAPLGYTKKCRTRGSRQGFGEVWCFDRRPTETARKRYTVLVALAGLAVVAGAVLFAKRMRSKLK